MQPTICIKRAYDDPSEKDGYRILVDRLWPRGIAKKDLPIDEWAKDMAPTTDLRKWFGHLPERWNEFKRLYTVELKDNPSVETFIQTHRQYPIITLVSAAKDEAHTHALVLQDFLKKKFSKNN